VRPRGWRGSGAGGLLPRTLRPPRWSLQGVDGLIDAAPGPEEGFVPPPAKAKTHRAKRVVAKRGTGRHGERMDELTVSISSNAEDQDVETDAEIEALT
jgi:hypothetical protein